MSLKWKKIKEALTIESAAAALELSYYGNGSAAAQLLLILATGTTALQMCMGNFHPTRAKGGLQEKPTSLKCPDLYWTEEQICVIKICDLQFSMETVLRTVGKSPEFFLIFSGRKVDASA